MKSLTTAAVFLMLIAALFTGCGGGAKKISPDEAMKMMESESNYVILDVRTEPEYNRRHIANAQLHPIGELRQGVMPTAIVSDKNQLVFVYCWAGRRAEEAANILAENGYTNVYDIGGLATWKGETIEGEADD